MRRHNTKQCLKYINNNDQSKDIIFELKDYMFTQRNIEIFTKQIFNIGLNQLKPKASNKHIHDLDFESDKTDCRELNKNVIDNKKSCNQISRKLESKKLEPKMMESKQVNKNIVQKKKELIYKPKQTDSLFWCFYILKHGYFKYEMEINNQYFVVEKNEKFQYIEKIRKNKDLLKLHKIKPFTELEDDLANKDKISIKTFFALCIIENINIMLVHKRKVYEVLSTDIDDTNKLNVIHKNNLEHWIELEPTNQSIQNYRETYFKMDNFDSTLKSMSSYKLDELIDLCKRLDINIESLNKDKKRLIKKDYYEALVINF